MKYKFDLQLFAEAVQGKKIVYLYRILEDAATDDGALIAFTTRMAEPRARTRTPPPQRTVLSAPLAWRKWRSLRLRFSLSAIR